MSRRAKRGKRSGGGWLVRLAVLLLVLTICGAAVGYGVIRSYLHSDGFRVMLSNQVSEALEVEGAFSPLQWDGLAARTGRFEATGGGPLLAIRADDVRTEIGLDGFRDGYWLLKGTAARSLEVTYDGRAGDEEMPVVADVPPLPEEEEKSGWLPSELRFDTVDVDGVSATVILDDGELRLRDHRVRVRSIEGNDAIDVEVQGGMISTPLNWLPELRLHEVKARYRHGVVFLTDADFRVFENGRLDAAGEWHEATGHYGFQGAAAGIDITDLLDEDWSRRLTGRLRADYSVEDTGAGTRARGSLELLDGVLTALPLLDSLSAYADTRRFRTMPLHEARADWEWFGGRFSLRNLRLASDGLARIEGRLDIGPNGGLDGNFRLGLAPGSLARIPGAETVVFRPGEHGLMWTSLRVGGTLDDPSEDLSDRLIAAAGMRMFEVLPESGERVLRHTRTLLGELPPDAVNRAMNLLGGREGEGGGRAGKIIRETGNILDKLFGGADGDEP